MAYRRRRRRTWRRRKSYRKRWSRRRGGRGRRRVSAVKRIHHYKRTYEAAAIAAQTLGVHGIFSATFNNIPEPEEFYDLYDSYKITKIVMRFQGNATGNTRDISTSATTLIPSLHTVIDTTDANPLTSLNDYMEYTSYRRCNWNQSMTRVIYPRVSVPIYQTGTSNAYGPAKGSTWISFDYVAVPHYGLKLYIDPPAGASLILPKWRVFITTYFSCKDVK